MNSSPDTARSSPFFLPFLLVAGSLTNLPGGAIAPVLPEIVKELHLDATPTGSFLASNLTSVHCLTIAACSVPLGILAERWGQRQVLVSCAIAFAFVGGAGAFVSNIWLLLLARLLLGAASGGIAVACLGILGSAYEGEERAQMMGYATSSLAISGIVYPLLGGIVGLWGWRYAFGLYFLVLPLAFVARAVLPARFRTTGKSPIAGRDGLQKLLTNSHIVRLLVALGLVAIAMYAGIVYSPQYLKVAIGANTMTNGIVLAIRAVGAIAVATFGTKQIARRWGREKAIAIGFAIMAATLCTVPLLRQLFWICLSSAFFGVGFGIALPNLYDRLASLVPPASRSTLLAVGTGASFLGQFLSPIVLDPFRNLSSTTLEGLGLVFYAAAGATVAAGLLLFPPRGNR